METGTPPDGPQRIDADRTVDRDGHIRQVFAALQEDHDGRMAAARFAHVVDGQIRLITEPAEEVIEG